MTSASLSALRSARAVVDAVLGCLVLVGEENATAQIRRDEHGLPIVGRVLVNPSLPEPRLPVRGADTCPAVAARAAGSFSS